MINLSYTSLEQRWPSHCSNVWSLVGDAGNISPNQMLVYRGLNFYDMNFDFNL